MRVIISSKYLQRKLNEFAFKKDYIHSLCIVDKDSICLYGTVGMSRIKLNVHHNGSGNNIEQSDANWDHVKTLMNQVDEQPIVLDIAKNSVQVIFQY